MVKQDAYFCRVALPQGNFKFFKVRELSGKPRILSLFLTRLINSIKHEHSCKILYLLENNQSFTLKMFAYSDRERIFSMRQWPFIIQNQCDILKNNVTFSTNYLVFS